MDQQILWPLYADSTFSQFVHWVISCDYMIIFVYSMVGWVICHLILFRVLIKRVSGFTVAEVCDYETMFFHGATMTMKFPRQCNVMQLKSFRALSLFWLPETYPDNYLVYLLVLLVWFYEMLCQKWRNKTVKSITSNRSPPGMILLLALLLKYWIEHVTIGLLYVKFIVSTRILYKGVPGLATDCLCGVGCC